MRLLKLSLSTAFAFILLLAMPSCKKNKSDSGSLSIAGTWVPLNDTTSKYFIADDNGNGTYLSEGSYGIHSLQNVLFQITEQGQLIMANSGAYAKTYSFRKNGDSLILESTNDRKLFKKTTDTPDKNTWVRKATLSDFHDLSFVFQFGDLDGDGSYFYIKSTYAAKKIYKVNASTFEVVDSTLFPKASYGFAVHQNKIWLTDIGTPTNNLYTLDFTTGTYNFTSVANTSSPILPFSNGTELFAFDNATQSLLNYNTVANSFSVVKTLPRFPFISSGSGIASTDGDCAYQNGSLYFVVYNLVFKFNLTTYRFEETYTIGEGLATGIHSDGSNLWVSGVHTLSGLSLDTKPYIAKLNF